MNDNDGGKTANLGLRWAEHILVFILQTNFVYANHSLDSGGFGSFVMNNSFIFIQET